MDEVGLGSRFSMFKNFKKYIFLAFPIVLVTSFSTSLRGVSAESVFDDVQKKDLESFFKFVKNVAPNKKIQYPDSNAIGAVYMAKAKDALKEIDDRMAEEPNSQWAKRVSSLLDKKTKISKMFYSITIFSERTKTLETQMKEVFAKLGMEYSPADVRDEARIKRATKKKVGVSRSKSTASSSPESANVDISQASKPQLAYANVSSSSNLPTRKTYGRQERSGGYGDSIRNQGSSDPSTRRN